MKKLEFNLVIESLNAQLEETVLCLKDTPNSPEFISLKVQLETAIKTLSFCEKHQLSPLSEVREIPFPKNYFCRYSLVELDESDEPNKPLTEGDDLVTVDGGDLIIHRPTSLLKYL